MPLQYLTYLFAFCKHIGDKTEMVRATVLQTFHKRGVQVIRECL